MLKRTILQRLLQEKTTKKASILIGPRQVGKTTLLHMLEKSIDKHQSLFLDMDMLSDYERLKDYETAIKTLQLSGYRESQDDFFYLFIDEFQRYPSITTFIKNIYDHHDNIKIYATGSSSLVIKKNIQESLAGRKFLHYIFPLDFKEFLLFKRDHEAQQQYDNIKEIVGVLPKNKLSSLLEEYLIFGGYPEVVLTNDLEEKKHVLKSIFDLYVKKELVAYLKIDQLLAVKNLVRSLAINNGQLTKYQELQSVTGLSFHEVKNYLEILKETYLLFELKPFFTNKNKELVKMPKIYFVDPGVRNHFINNFNELDLRADTGALFETYLLAEFTKRGKETINYWRTKQGLEVDFILTEGEKIFAVEAKYKNQLRSSDFKGLNEFKELYPKSETFLINKNQMVMNDDHIIISPFNVQKYF